MASKIRAGHMLPIFRWRLGRRGDRVAEAVAAGGGVGGVVAGGVVGPCRRGYAGGAYAASLKRRHRSRAVVHGNAVAEVPCARRTPRARRARPRRG